MKSNLIRWFSFTLSICIPKTSTSCWMQYCWKTEEGKVEIQGVFSYCGGVIIRDASCVVRDTFVYYMILERLESWGVVVILSMT